MPKPSLPPYRRVEGDTGKAIADVRSTLAGVLDQSHIFGNAVSVTFPAANTSVRVVSGLPGAISGYRTERCSVAMNVFDGSPTDGTPTNDRGVQWLQASAAGTATIYFY